MRCTSPWWPRRRQRARTRAACAACRCSTGPRLTRASGRVSRASPPPTSRRAIWLGRDDPRGERSAPRPRTFLLKRAPPAIRTIGFCYRGSARRRCAQYSGRFCLGKRGVEVLKIPSHDQRPRLFGDAPPPMALFWLVRRSTAVTVAESRPTTPLRHRHRSGGQGSRSTARRAPPVPRRGVGVPLRAADQNPYQSNRSIGTASSCRVEPCSHMPCCGQQIGCECSPAETVSWTSRRNTQVPSLT